MLKCIQCRPHYWHVASPSCSTGSRPFASSCSVLPSCVRISPSSLCSRSFSAARTANCLSTSALAPMLITLSVLKTDPPVPSQHGLICASWPPRASLIGPESLLTLLRTPLCCLGLAKLLFGYYPFTERRSQGCGEAPHWILLTGGPVGSCSSVG